MKFMTKSVLLPPPPRSQALSHDTKRFEVRARVLDMYNTVVLHRDM